MATSVPVPEVTQQAPERVAPLWHTALLIAFLLFFSFLGSEGHPGLNHAARMRFYSLTIAMEWALVGYIVWGIRRSRRTTLRGLIGGRWNKPEDFLLDIAVAVGFWIVAMLCLGLVGIALGMNNPAVVKESVKEMQHRIGSLLPTGTTEIALWVVLSCTAGFCEEVIYRGYLQRQIAGVIHSSWLAVILQGVIFGGSHAYEGWQKMIQIAVFGILFGILAQLRKSLRPGMIAHAGHDIFQGIVAGFVLKNADKFLPK